MIITLIAHERNLGILPLTDFIIDRLGKQNCAVIGSNYLNPEVERIIQLKDKFSQENKNVIIKFIIPKEKFSNQNYAYPSDFYNFSDVVFRIPRILEELQNPPVLDIIKGIDNPFVDTLKGYYGA
jgi:hypothetical protein